MIALRRHQLARITALEWAALSRHAWDCEARNCLNHWRAHHLPLVVTRQRLDRQAAGVLSLGLPAPLLWGRRRLQLEVRRDALMDVDEFPHLDAVEPSLTEGSRAPMRALSALLKACGATVRVFGSYGWQTITGLHYLRPDSDLDLCIGVADPIQADAVTARLRSFTATAPRIDGELVFADGSAVAWREWDDWRCGRVREVMVKRLERVTLERDAAWCEAKFLVPAPC